MEQFQGVCPSGEGSRTVRNEQLEMSLAGETEPAVDPYSRIPPPPGGWMQKAHGIYAKSNSEALAILDKH